MTDFNPDFWEVTLASERWARLSQKDALWHEPPDEADLRQERDERARGLKRPLKALIDKVLTERQREVVMLYYFRELNQRQIAEVLGISQQAVSEHLYGKMRNGRAVGGAMRKMEKACAERGISWP